MMDQATYERIKTELKAERETQREIGEGWRTCPICKDQWRHNQQCDTHRQARQRSIAARDALRQHINDNRLGAPPPTREERRLASLNRKGIKGVWQSQEDFERGRQA
jgi:hypothetical protein